MTTYCCFLPDLTEFMGFCCAGPERQHQSVKADHKAASPQMGIQPRYSGLRVQGTATSPLSTASFIITFSGKNAIRGFLGFFGNQRHNIIYGKISLSATLSTFKLTSIDYKNIYYFLNIFDFNIVEGRIII